MFKPTAKTLRLNWTSEDNPHIREARCGLRNGSLTLVGGRVYWAGPRGILYYFSLTDWKWYALGNHLAGVSEREFPEASALCEDKIYYCSGTLRQKIVEYDVALRHARSLDKASGSGPMETNGMSIAFASWRREIVLYGGQKIWLDQILSSDIYTFNVDSHNWKRIKMRGELPPSRRDHAAEMFGRAMYIFGGISDAFTSLDDLWIAHLGHRISPFWSKPLTVGLCPSSRTLSSLNGLNGYLVVFGGINGETTFDDVHIFCPRKRQWKAATDSGVRITGVGPKDTFGHQGVSTSAGIVYFTKASISLLSESSTR